MAEKRYVKVLHSDAAIPRVAGVPAEWEDVDQIIDERIPAEAGLGNVVGPASATADHLAVFEGATGKIIKDGGALPSVPVKATGAEVDTGTDDAKFVTAKAIADSSIGGAPGGGVTNSAGANEVPVSDGTNLVSADNLEAKLPINFGSFTVVTQELNPSINETVTGAGTNSLSEGFYQWKLVTNTLAGHSSPSSATSAILNDPATNAPPSILAPFGYSNFAISFDLYRTEADGSDYKLVASGLTIGQFPYSDDIPDASLGALIPSDNTTANPKLLIDYDTANIDGVPIPSNSAPANTVPVTVDGSGNLGPSLFIDDGIAKVGMAELAPEKPDINYGDVSGVSQLSSGDYRWKLVYITAEGHTEPGSASNIVAVNPVDGILPTVGNRPVTDFVTSVEVYRTEANGSTYKLAAMGLDPVSDFPYTDNLPDASLGALAPSTNTTANPTPVQSTAFRYNYAPTDEKAVAGSLWVNTNIPALYINTGEPPGDDWQRVGNVTYQLADHINGGNAYAIGNIKGVSVTPLSGGGTGVAADEYNVIGQDGSAGAGLISGTVDPSAGMGYSPNQLRGSIYLRNPDDSDVTPATAWLKKTTADQADWEQVLTFAGTPADGELLVGKTSTGTFDKQIMYHSAAVAPTANDDSADGYQVGTTWIDTVLGDAYICVDNTLTAAVWKKTTP